MNTSRGAPLRDEHRLACRGPDGTGRLPASCPSLPAGPHRYALRCTPLRHPDTDAAAEAVRGIYLGYASEIIAAFFFGHCNGRTRSPSEAG
jgi:hypothetical protein